LHFVGFITEQHALCVYLHKHCEHLESMTIK